MKVHADLGFECFKTWEKKERKLLVYLKSWLFLSYSTGSGTNNTPFCYRIFYYEIISMWFCNVTTSHSSTPYDILGEMFKLKLNYYNRIITLPTTLTQVLLLPDPVFIVCQNMRGLSVLIKCVLLLLRGLKSYCEGG